MTAHTRRDNLRGLLWVSPFLIGATVFLLVPMALSLYYSMTDYSVLEPPLRLPLWHGTLARFFQWVWLSVGLLLATGLHMTMKLGGFAAPLHARVMLILGVIMMLVFAHVFFAPFARLGRAVASGDWPAGGAALGQIRRLVGINLILGIVTITIATAGRLVLH